MLVVAGLGALFLIGCDKEEPIMSPSGRELQKDRAHFIILDDKVMLDQEGANQSTQNIDGGSWQSTLASELLDARFSTVRYRDINNAIADGYVDINVVVPHMGVHYLKSGLVDATFDPSHPEILVYNTIRPGGPPTLVAVEYAVPLNLSQNPPEGFTGNLDVWDENQTFGLWLLHAWVWYPNPTGVFSGTNPLVP